MRTATLTALPLLLALAAQAPAQAPAWRFQWQPGQVFSYRVDHVMTATEVVEDAKVETVNKMQSVKRWQVLAVDAAGAATLQLSMSALRFETTTHKGDVLLFDSSNLDKSTPALREQMAKYVNAPLAVLRVDGTGKVVEVKECKQGSPSRFESEPPFGMVLPAMAPRPGQAWDRPYQVTLDPPQGTGEKYAATQKFVCKSMDAKGAIFGLTTLIPTMPEAAADRVPFLQLQPEGEIVFDPVKGRTRAVRLAIDKVQLGHQGEGSSYRFKSTYTEELMEP